MKIKGQPLPGPHHRTEVFPRPQTDDGQNQDIVFECRAVLDYSEFESLVPEPEIPKILKPGQPASSNPQDPAYILKQNQRAMKQTHWMYVQSLMATEGLEWDQVKLDQPETWHLWTKELSDSGLSVGEISRLQNAVHEVNGLDESKMEEARKSFLAGKRAALSQ